MSFLHSGIAMLSLFVIVASYECINGTNNKFFVASDSKKLPITLEGLEVTVFDKNMKPSCAFDQPNVLFPGYFIYAKGKIHVKKPYKFNDETVVKVTAISESGTKYCVEGESAQWYLPDALCVYDFCEAVGAEVCKVLGKPGIHSIEDLIEKSDYKRVVKLPDEPCFLNALCAHDILGGRYHLKLSIEHKGKLISRWNVPSNTKFVQFYVNEDDEGDDDDDEGDDDIFFAKVAKLKAKNKAAQN